MLVAFRGIAEVLPLDRLDQRGEQIIYRGVVFSAYFDEFGPHLVGQTLAILERDGPLSCQVLLVADEYDRCSGFVMKRSGERKSGAIIRERD